MPNKQVSKSGIPFITFLIVVTIAVAIWFLVKSDKVKEDIGDTVNLSVNQVQSAGAGDVNSAGKVNQQDEEMTVFQNPEYKFSYNLLASEAVKEEKSSTIYTVYFDSDKLTVMNENMEPAVKEAISVQSNVEAIVDGIQGEEITATSAKDGSEVNLILVKNDGKLFHFQGTTEFLKKIKTEFFFEN
jgi:hypothetical protein